MVGNGRISTGYPAGPYLGMGFLAADENYLYLGGKFIGTIVRPGPRQTPALFCSPRPRFWMTFLSRGRGQNFHQNLEKKSIFLIIFFENVNYFHQNIEKKSKFWFFFNFDVFSKFRKKIFFEILIFFATPAPAPSPAPVLQFWSTPAPDKFWPRSDYTPNFIKIGPLVPKTPFGGRGGPGGELGFRRYHISIFASLVTIVD